MNPSLRLTPRASPAPRTPVVKSPIKTIHEEPRYLSLRKIIGCTVASSNAVSHNEAQRMVAYIAGASAVVLCIDDELQIRQRAFRATSVGGLAGPFNPSQFDSPLSSPSIQSQRARVSAASRDLNAGMSAFASPWNESIESPSGRVAALKNKSKAATCVALSQDGKWLAMGENGYKPRVLIFSLIKDSINDTPAYSLAEHTFGVKCLVFSADTQYLASLGDINDGFLYIWTVHQRTGGLALCASNRCTSNVRAMAWMGSVLITVGTRHVKIWRIDKNPQVSPTKKLSDATFALASPSKPLAGRNCILGPLLDKTFITVVPVDPKRALVCSEDGDICLLEDNDFSPTFTLVSSVGGAIKSSCLVNNTSFLVGGECGSIRQYDIEQLVNVDKNAPIAAKGRVLETEPPIKAQVVALAAFRDFTLAFDSYRCILPVPHADAGSPPAELSLVMSQLPTHPSSIRGVKKASAGAYQGAAFLTYSGDGCALIWDLDGKCLQRAMLQLEQPSPTPETVPNEVRAMSQLTLQCEIHYGDREGYLKTYHLISGTHSFEAKAHAGEITAIDVYQGQWSTYIASAGRDRTVQLFRAHKGCTELLQTLDDHIGGVVDVKFSADASKLLSCSTDRSVLIRCAIRGGTAEIEQIAYIPSRTITLKATPLCLEVFHRDQREVLAVSSMDKTISQYSLESNASPDTFRVGDDEDGDLVNLNTLISIRSNQGRHAIAGIASSDKSVRLYGGSGSFLGRDYGQTEGMTGIASIGPESAPFDSGLVTVAGDGTIFIWNLDASFDRSLSTTDTPDISQGTPKANAFFASRPPLRRVLSSSELTKLQGSQADVPAVVASPQAGSRSPNRKAATRSRQVTPESEPTSPAKDVAGAKGVSNTFDSLSQRPKRRTRSRPPSPSSPRRVQQSKTLPKQLRRQSSQPVLSTVSRRRSIGNSILGPSTPTALIYGSQDLLASSQHICRSLHTYRKKLSVSDEPLPIEHVRELERELSLTARALAEKAARSEAVMEKLLDRYGERLVEIMERRIDEKVGKLVEEGMALRKSEGGEEFRPDARTGC